MTEPGTRSHTEPRAEASAQPIIGPATTRAGAMLPPGAGRVIAGGGLHATLKVAGGPNALTSTFEIAVPAGYDVGAHVHSHGEELFFVLEGTIDLLAFEPTDRGTPDWHDWTSLTGQQFMRGGPGALLFVPAGCPHAFANLSDKPATLLFQAAPSGHEDYFDELAALLRASDGPPDPESVAEIRSRHDIQQITGLRDRPKQQS
jgi:quercetin dioxygenase-like cupin family protein